VPDDRPVTATSWCRVEPAGSITVVPPTVTDPVVGSLVHHEMTAEEPVTLEEKGPRAIVTVPGARVLADLAGEAVERRPFESMALIVYEYAVLPDSPLSE